MKKLLLFSFLLIAIVNTSNAQINANIKDSLNKEIINLKRELDEIKQKQSYQENQINNQTGMIDTAFDGVSTELSASSNFIGVVSVIIGFLSIGLTIIVAVIQNSVKNMKKDTEELLKTSIKVKQKIESLSGKITKDVGGLYKLIRNEESNHILDRLISVPEDIVNLFGNLASRELEESSYIKLKEAFIQVRDIDAYKNDYIVLFFQHFSGQSLLDNDIKQYVFDELDTAFEAAFKGDMIKATSDYFNSISTQDILIHTNEINMYLVALNNSKFAESDDVYLSINISLSDREQKFKLYDLIDNNANTEIVRRKIGSLILEYNYEDLTEEETITITNINTLLNI